MKNVRTALVPRAWLARVAVLTAVATACEDLPTGSVPTPTHSTNTAHTSAGLRLGETPSYCAVSRRAPSTASGWQTRPDTIFFPRSEVDAAGRKVRYDYRQSLSDGRNLVFGTCIVPYTEAALRRVDREFGVRSGGGAEQFKTRQERITVQGCVSDGGVCPLEPIYVNPPPVEPSDGGGTPEPDGHAPGGSTGSGTGGTPAGEEPTPEEEADAATCPSILSGKVITALITVAGRTHEFRFDGPMQRVGRGSKPATYQISGPKTSEDSWWIAESGTITVTCWGFFTPQYQGARLWIGTANYAGQSDLHMVMGPGHPDF